MKRLLRHIKYLWRYYHKKFYYIDVYGACNNKRYKLGPIDRQRLLEAFGATWLEKRYILIHHAMELYLLDTQSEPEPGMLALLENTHQDKFVLAPCVTAGKYSAFAGPVFVGSRTLVDHIYYGNLVNKISLI